MNKLFCVIKREYVTRVQNKAFIAMTLLTPLFLSLLFFLPSYFSKQHENIKQMRIGVIDVSGTLTDEEEVSSELDVEWLSIQHVNKMNDLVQSNQYEGVVCVCNSDSLGTNIQYYSKTQPSVFLLNKIKLYIQAKVINKELGIYGISNVDNILQSIKSSITIRSVKMGEKHSQSIDAPYHRTLCLALGITIYLFIFLFSSQVMRGVLEEKSNRIMELIITSISPVKFMTGKIIGIALLGVTQILCWLTIMYIVTFFVSETLEINTFNSFISQRISQEDITQLLNNLSLIDFNVIIPVFLFFFISGYLLYSSLFAAIAAAVNSSNDIQQVTTIVTMPLILSIFILTNTINSPDSPLSYWFSLIPFTSPIVMVGRVVYGVPFEQIILSMTILAITVGLTIWISGKVYQITILYTGKKISLNELISLLKKNNK